MVLARIALERLLLLLFLGVRVAFLWQGMACVGAAGTLLAAEPGEAPEWLRSTLLSVLAVSATFFLAGVLLFVVRHRFVARAGTAPLPAPAWPSGLALSLVIVPALAAHTASDLLPLWRRIAALLDAIGFRDELLRGNELSGILVLPVFFALLVPALLTAAALVEIALPLLLLPLLPARSRLFPTLLAMAAVSSAALLVAGALALDAFARLSELVLSALAASREAGAEPLAAQLHDAIGVLRAAASGLVAPLLVVLGWVVFLRPGGEAAAWFGADAEGATQARTAVAGPTSRGGHGARLALLVLGALGLLSSAGLGSAPGLRGEPARGGLAALRGHTSDADGSSVGTPRASGPAQTPPSRPRTLAMVSARAWAELP